MGCFKMNEKHQIQKFSFKKDNKVFHKDLNGHLVNDRGYLIDGQGNVINRKGKVMF